MKIKSHIFFLVIFLQNNNIKTFSMERAPEKNMADVAKERRVEKNKAQSKSKWDAYNKAEQEKNIQVTSKTLAEPIEGFKPKSEMANESNQNKHAVIKLEVAESLPQATPLNGKLIEGSHSFRIDPTQPIEAIQPEPIQAIRINEAFDPKNLEFVDGEQQELPSLFKSNETFSEQFTNYNARRTGQADPLKSGKALINMRNTMKNVDVYNMDGADVLKFSDYQDQLSLIETQWVKDPTQIKSADLVNFLNEFKDFAGKQMNHYDQSSLDRSSWQKVIDAIQDFFDLAFGHDVQPTVVAQPIHEELLPQHTKLQPIS